MARKKMFHSSTSAPNPIDETLYPQNLLKDPSKEICRFTDSEIKAIAPFFPDGAKFCPFDPSATSDSISERWVCFPATPFLLGFTYPFPDLTEEFFIRTGISFIQAMPMIWRTLSVIEEALASTTLEFGVSELSYLYSLVTHGSSRFVLKSKSGKFHPVLKIKQNDQEWKGQFFFVDKASIPGGQSLPKKWVTKVKNFGKFAEEQGTEERVKAFLALDPKVRTFHPKISKSEAVDTPSNSMSTKSITRSSSKFALDDIDSLLNKKSSVKVTNVAPVPPKPTTRPKSTATKRKRSSDPADVLENAKKSMTFSLDSLADGIASIDEYYKKIVKELEEELSSLRSIAASKDEEINKLMEEKKVVEENAETELKAVDIKWGERVKEIADEAKASALIALLQCRIKFAEEAKDPSFDRSAWDVEYWKNTLKELVEDEEDTTEKVSKPSVEVKGKGKLIDEAEVEAEVCEEEGGTDEVDASVGEGGKQGYAPV